MHSPVPNLVLKRRLHGDFMSMFFFHNPQRNSPYSRRTGGLRMKPPPLKRTLCGCISLSTLPGVISQLSMGTHHNHGYALLGLSEKWHPPNSKGEQRSITFGSIQENVEMGHHFFFYKANTIRQFVFHFFGNSGE